MHVRVVLPEQMAGTCSEPPHGWGGGGGDAKPYWYTHTHTQAHEYPDPAQ